MSSNRLVNGALQSLSLAVDECARALLAALLTRPLQTVVRRLDIQGCGLAVRRVHRLTHASSPKPVRPAHSYAPYSSGMRLTEAHWTVSRGFGTKRAYLASTRLLCPTPLCPCEMKLKLISAALFEIQQGFVPELLTDLAPAGVLFLADLAISAIFEPSVLFGV